MFGVLLGISCSGPGSYEEFVRAEDATGGVYEFALPADAYDLSFYTAPLDEPLQLEITLDSLKETVWFPAGQYKALYRSGIQLDHRQDSLTAAGVIPALAEKRLGQKSSGRHPQRSRALPGTEYLLQVRPIDPPEDFRGLGIIIKRNDGTR